MIILCFSVVDLSINHLFTYGGFWPGPYSILYRFDVSVNWNCLFKITLVLEYNGTTCRAGSKPRVTLNSFISVFGQSERVEDTGFEDSRQ